MSEPEPMFVVIHEWQHPSGHATYDAASSIHTHREPAENALAYCEGMQEQGRRGTEGRYFVAEVRELTAPHPHPLEDRGHEGASDD